MEFIKRFTPGNIIETVKASNAAARMLAAGGNVVVVEADTMKTLELEDDGWIPLTHAKRELTPWNHEKMIKVAEHLSRNSHVASRILEIFVDFIVGDGIAVTSDVEEIQDAINEFWNDPINDMDNENGSRVKETLTWGEICMPALVDEKTGNVRLGWIDVGFIQVVHPHPITGRPGILEMKQSYIDAGGNEKLAVINWDDKTNRLVGDVFFYGINGFKGGRRGVSELFTSADLIDALGEITMSQVDRTKLMNAFIWDVELMGASLPQIKEWLKDNRTPPAPGSIRAHNEKVKWTAVSPQLGNYEVSRLMTDLLDLVMGGHGIPSHFFGSGGDANRATATTMAEPFRKAMKRKTQVFTSMWTDIIKYMIQSKVVAGTLKVTPEEMDSFKVIVPDIGGPDVAKTGAAMVSMGASIQQAEDAEFISHETAIVLFAAVASQTGIEVDPADEKAKMETESKDRDSKETNAADDMETALNKVLKQAQTDADAGKGAMKPEDATAALGGAK